MKFENTKTLKINGNEYEFVNGWSRTRYSTTEKSELLKNGYRLSTGRYTWINRPWQCYDYEMAMNDAVNNLLNEKMEELKRDYLNSNGYKKLTASRREELENIYNNNDSIKEFKTVKELIHNGYYNGFYYQTTTEF